MRLQLLLLLLFSYSAKILNSRGECLTTSLLLVTKLDQPHAIVVRLQLRKFKVVTLTAEPAGTVGV